jgi:quercetin dioxygenase-like cupin family protein
MASDRRLMSAFDELTDIAPLQIWPGLIARALDGVEATLAAIELEPDVEVPEHSHVNEQIGILTGGSMTFRIGGEERELRPGATWNIPAHVPHSVRSGPDGATLIEVFAPARADWADRERLDPRAPKVL